MKEHKISLASAVLMNMNIMIGSGILLGPGRIAAISGNASFLAWPLVALIFVPMVFCAAQLSKMFPGCGGFYAYSKEGINTVAGLFSGLLYVIGYTFAVAIEVMFLRIILIRTVGNNWFLDNATLFHLVALLVFIGLNLMSFKLFSNMLNSLTVTKILPMVVLILLLPFIFKSNFTISMPELISLPNSLTFAIFGFFGFEYCCSLTHLIENSNKNGPRAAILGFLITAALYTLFHFGVLNLMGAQTLAQSGASAFADYLTLPIPFLKPFLMFLIPLASVLVVFAAGNGILNANLIMLQSMANDRLFWKWSALTRLNRYGRPYVVAILEGFIVMGIILLMPSIDAVGNLCNYGILLSYLLPFISLFLLQRKRKSSLVQIMITCLAIIAVLGLSGYSWLLLGSTMYERTINTLPLLGILVVGYFFFLMRDRSQKQSEQELLFH